MKNVEKSMKIDENRWESIKNDHFWKLRRWKIERSERPEAGVELEAGGAQAMRGELQVKDQ